MITYYNFSLRSEEKEAKNKQTNKKNSIDTLMIAHKIRLLFQIWQKKVVLH